jgi:hypothetical protein
MDKFLGNLKTHLDAQRIARTAGDYQLTPAPKAYFNDCYHHGIAQRIDRAKVEQVIRGINTEASNDE